MWRILKEELAYNKLLIFLMVAFCIACFVTIWFGVKWQRNRAPLTMLIMLVMTVVVGYSGVKNRIGQKRDRMYLLLPLSLRQVGCTHLLYPLSIWLSIALVFFASYLTVQQASTTWLTSPSVLQLLTLNGLILCFNAVTLLYADLRMAFPKKQHKFVIFVFWLLIYFAVFLPFYIVTDFGGFFGEGTPLQLFLNDLSVSPVGFNLAGVILSVISLIIFIRRQSYAAS